MTTPRLRVDRARRTMLVAGMVLALSLAVPQPAIAGPVPAAGSAVTAKSTALKITQQPKTTKVMRGAKATFTVKATGSSLKYQWYISRFPLDSVPPYKWERIPGATKSSYTVPGILRLHSAIFHVVVTSGGRSVTSSNAMLKVGSSYVRGSWQIPTRSPEHPFRPGETAFYMYWAVSVEKTRRSAVSEGRVPLSMKFAAFRGPIADALLQVPRKVEPMKQLIAEFVSDRSGATYRAKLSGLSGSSAKGYTLTAKVSVPVADSEGVWIIHDVTREVWHGVDWFATS